MIRPVLVIFLVFISLLSIAQNKGATALSKITDSASGPKIDYTQVGAPMPPFKVMVFRDTAKINPGTCLPISVASNSEHKGKGKKTPKLKNKGGNVNIADYKEYITNDDFNNKANLFVMIFNPNCGHCEDETFLLEKNIGLFKKSRIILMANLVMWDYLPNFSRSLHLGDYPNFILGTVNSDFVNNIFLYKPLPQINIYDHQHKLLKTFTGEVAIDSLSACIE